MKHPRRDLPFTCSRRTFFRALFQEAAIIRGSLKGRPGCRLSELGSLPDQQLSQIKPVLHSQYEVFVDGGYVWARNKLKEQVLLKLFSTEEKENLVPFKMFDGQHTLGEIGNHLAREVGWDEARAFAHVRDLFLSLVAPMVYIPKEPPDSYG
jgi:hypothetical protein